MQRRGSGISGAALLIQLESGPCMDSQPHHQHGGMIQLLDGISTNQLIQIHYYLVPQVLHQMITVGICHHPHFMEILVSSLMEGQLMEGHG